MICYTPLSAGFDEARNITFNPNNIYGSPLTLPCGQCIGCRLERSRNWATRAMHEYQSQDYIGSFLTLTYSEPNLPPSKSLDSDAMPLFFRRLKKHLYPKKISYLYCGEYGDKFDRPHYHALVFNHDFDLSKNKAPQITNWGANSLDSLLNTKSSDDSLYLEPVSHHELGCSYQSKTLNNLWQLGHASVGSLTYESAAYVARYCLKKINGAHADTHYNSRTPEFMHSSKPAIGRSWIEKYHEEIALHGNLYINKRLQNIPRYYLKILEKLNPNLYTDLKIQRESTTKKTTTTKNLYDSLLIAQSKLNSTKSLTLRDNYYLNYFSQQLRREKKLEKLYGTRPALPL